MLYIQRRTRSRRSAVLALRGSPRGRRAAHRRRTSLAATLHTGERSRSVGRLDERAGKLFSIARTQVGRSLSCVYRADQVHSRSFLSLSLLYLRDRARQVMSRNTPAIDRTTPSLSLSLSSSENMIVLQYRWKLWPLCRMCELRRFECIDETMF